MATILESLVDFGSFPRVTWDRQILWDYMNFCRVSTVGDITTSFPRSRRMLIRERRWETDVPMSQCYLHLGGVAWEQPGLDPQGWGSSSVPFLMSCAKAQRMHVFFNLNNEVNN